MEKLTSLTDFIRIKPDTSVLELTDEAKRSLIDSATGPDSRGLLITFDLSHSGKRINNRIYPPWGQQAGVDSWTSPFPKPILLNHDMQKDPIGRFVSVTWISEEARAIKYLGSVQKYVKLKRAFDSRNPKTIYSAMAETGVLTDKNWPGMGRLEAQAKISDSDAIEKFVDGRYLTFSAGTHTDSFNCMVCGAGWHLGDRCDCPAPGMTDDEGKIGTHLTGMFMGREGSVVNGPADNHASVRSLQFDDSIEARIGGQQDWMLQGNEPAFILTDSTMAVATQDTNTQSSDVETVEQKFADLMELDTNTIATLLVEDRIDFDLIDALSGSSHLEIKWLVRMHDSLHFAYDHVVGGESPLEGSMESMPMDVFKLHGALHDISMARDFRGTLINGPLDNFDERGSPDTKYAAKRPASKDSEDIGSAVQALRDMIMGIVNDIKDQKTTEEEVTDETTEKENTDVNVQDSSDTGVSETNQEEKEEEAKEEVTDTDNPTIKYPKEVVEWINTQIETVGVDYLVAGIQQLPAVSRILDGEEFVDDETIDWGLMDMGLEFLVGDAKLSTEAREKLDASSFCGPERSFPVPDCAHATAARRLIGRAKLSSDQKARVLACVNRKAKNMSCDTNNDSDCNCGNCRCKEYDTLNEDYARALTQVDSLKKRLETVLESHVKVSGKTISDLEDSNRLDLLVDWFDNINPTDEENSSLTIEDVKHVDNPADDTSEEKEIDVSASTSKENKLDDLSDFERRILKNFKQLRDERGEQAAHAYLSRQRRYVSRTFDPAKLLD